jgi:hypothetical protein
MDLSINNPLHNPYFGGITNFIQNQFTDLYTTLGEGARGLVDRAKNLYNNLYGSNLLARANIMAQSLDTTANPFSIYAITDPVAFNTASLYMQRFIMANPVLRQMYFDQRTFGYEDTYSNPEGEVYGENHYDYRLATNGMVRPGPDDMDVYVEYSDDIRPGDRELTMFEKADIAITWDAAEHYMSLGIDVLDPLAEK